MSNVGYGVCGSSGPWAKGHLDSGGSVDLLFARRSFGDCERKRRDVHTCTSTVFHSHSGLYCVGHVSCLGSKSADTFFVKRGGLGSNFGGYGPSLYFGQIRVRARITSPVSVLRRLSGKARRLRILLVWKGRSTPPGRMDRRPNRGRYSFASPIHAGPNQKMEAGFCGTIYICRKPQARAIPSRYWSHNFKPSSKCSNTRVGWPFAMASFTIES